MDKFADDRWVVELPAHETKRAVSEGLRRLHRNIDKEQRHVSRLGNDVQHIVGAIGECALAHYLGVPWTGAISHKHYDVGGWIEVRSTPRDRSALFLRPNDPRFQPEKVGPYVVASVRAESVVMLGWYDLELGRTDEFAWKDVWRVKQVDLRPMGELRYHPMRPPLDPTRVPRSEMKMPIRREANRHPLGEAGIG